MSDHYVLDACAVIALLNDEAGADIVEELLRKSNPQQPNVVLHRLNLLVRCQL
jgi:PIN domain nuclease of toxin-antitoxin system